MLLGNICLRPKTQEIIEYEKLSVAALSTDLINGTDTYQNAEA